MIEEWFDVLKKVMRLHSNEDFKKAVVSSDQIVSSSGQTERQACDDFYVYIYDEEDSWQPQNFKKKKQTSAKETNRKIGFWCFNAGIGMKSLAKL